MRGEAEEGWADGGRGGSGRVISTDHALQKWMTI